MNGRARTSAEPTLGAGDLARIVDRMAHQIIENIAKSGFDIEVADGLCEYICSFID